MSSEERMVKGGWFARLQGEVFRLGVPVGTDLTGLRDICGFMVQAAGEEAVDAATLFVTERQIAEACSTFAEAEQTAGRLQNALQLRQASVLVLKSVDAASKAEIKAVLTLPKDETSPLPPGLARRVELVGRLIAPTQNTKLGPLHRLVAEVISEAHEIEYSEGGSAMRKALANEQYARDSASPGDSVNPDQVAELVKMARRSARGAMEAALHCVRLWGLRTREGALADLIEARWESLAIWAEDEGAHWIGDHPVSPSDQAAPVRDDNLALWIKRYAKAIFWNSDDDWFTVERQAIQVTASVLASDGFAVTGILGAMMSERGFREAAAFRDYLGELPLGCLPEASLRLLKGEPAPHADLSADPDHWSAGMDPGDAARAYSAEWVQSEDPSVTIRAMDEASETYRAMAKACRLLTSQGYAKAAAAMRDRLSQAYVSRIVGTGDTEAAAREDAFRRMCIRCAEWCRSLAEMTEDHTLYEGAALIGAISRE